MSVLTSFTKACCVVVAVLQYSASAFDACNTDSLNMAQDLHHQRRLRSRVIESQPINKPIECHVKCMKNCRCVSYNVCNGRKLCELNSEKKKNNIYLYEKSDECDYHEFSFNRQQSSGCRDDCCSTSQACLHGARCQATCMENGRRFQCICAEGQGGDRCENVARNCAFYANSSNRTRGLRVIYAPNNTPYRAFCHLGNSTSSYHLTLAFSYSVENQQLFTDQPLTNDHPVLQDSPNWEKYRLGLERMKGLRDGAVKWSLACSYDQQRYKTNDVLVVFMHQLDPLGSSDGRKCPKVQRIGVNGQACRNCIVGIVQGGNAWHMMYHHADLCPSAVQVFPNLSCPSGLFSYFGNYNTNCLDKNFLCTSSMKATTQLWFFHKA